VKIKFLRSVRGCIKVDKIKSEGIQKALNT